MPRLLDQLLHDLLQRYRFLRAELLAVSSELPPEILGYRDRMLERIARSIGIIEGFLSDPDLSQPALTRNIFHLYKRLSEFAQSADEGPVFALRRFGDRDLFLTRVVTKMCNEFGFPYTPPLCTAMSTQYYCAVTGMDLVLLPHSEPDHLLGLPDVYHELGHFIVFRDPRLLEALHASTEAHFQSEIQRARSQAWPANSIMALQRYSNLWRGEWTIEFACDLIATAVCGPAFAWTNIRLCARLSSDFYEVVPSHPADAARTMAIKLMLQHLGFNGEADQIDRQWESLRQTAGQQEPQEFQLVFPSSLLADLVRDVVCHCEATGIKRYDPTSMPVARLLNEAWTRFLPDPSNYGSWETANISGLKQDLIER